MRAGGRKKGVFSMREGPGASSPTSHGHHRPGQHGLTAHGISNEPPGMRQETASGHALRVQPLSPQGIPLWGYQQLGGPACRWQQGVTTWSEVREGNTLGAMQLSKVWILTLTRSGTTQ